MIDFDEAQAYIAQENPFAAQAVAGRIVQAARRLAESPLAGSPGILPDTRHWVVQRTPYLIVYRVREDAIEVLRIWHGRRNWIPGADDQ